MKIILILLIIGEKITGKITKITLCFVFQEFFTPDKKPMMRERTARMREA